MTKQKVPVHLALPMGFVQLTKNGGREVALGIVGAERLPALGFDVKGLPPNHWRMVPYGNFGVFIGTRYPVEARVLLDGNLLLETQLIPNEQPGIKQGSKLDRKVQAMMLEQPQAFHLNVDGSGNLFNYSQHASIDDPNRVIAEQIHPGYASNPPSMHTLDKSAPTRVESKIDITEEELHTKLPQLRRTVQPGAVNPDNLLPREMVTSSHAQTQNSVANLQTTDNCGERSFDQIPILDPTRSSMTWAPSNGLVAIGVRFMQQIQGGELPNAPDSFTYTLFQLNPFKLHARARAMLGNRVVMLSPQRLHELAHESGNAEDCPAPVAACGCVHLAEPRRRRGRR